MARYDFVVLGSGPAGRRAAAMTGMVGVLVLMGPSPSHSIELWTRVVVAAGVVVA